VVEVDTWEAFEELVFHGAISDEPSALPFDEREVRQTKAWHGTNLSHYLSVQGSSDVTAKYTVSLDQQFESLQFDQVRLSFSLPFIEISRQLTIRKGENPAGTV
jgi:hypothetical protein